MMSLGWEEERREFCKRRKEVIEAGGLKTQFLESPNTQPMQDEGIKGGVAEGLLPP